MDIAEILKSADVAFEQVKKISSVTQDTGAIMSSITGFAGQLGELKRVMCVEEVQQLHTEYSGKKQKKSPTERALEVYTAKVKLEEFEKELYHMFLYGDLNHLGLRGYRDFCKIREDIEKESLQRAHEENTWEISKQNEEDFFKGLKIVGGAIFASVVAVVELAQQIKDLLQ